MTWLKQLALPKVTWKVMKGGKLMAHSKTVKPTLTESNMQQRIKVYYNHININHRMFGDMIDVVHIDENWFYFTPNKRKHYLVNEEGVTYRTANIKHFATDVMFLCDVSIPCWYSHNNCHFDGNICIWSFITCEMTRCSSCNLRSGAIFTKTIISVTADIYRTFLTYKVLPAIYVKLPRNYRELFSKSILNNSGDRAIFILGVHQYTESE